MYKRIFNYKCKKWVLNFVCNTADHHYVHMYILYVFITVMQYLSYMHAI